MFKIITPEGLVILTEKPTYIRRHPSGVLLRSARKEAVGVSFGGHNYLFEDGAALYQFDGADELRELYAENKSLREQLAATDEATIELFETALMQEEINAEQDEAIIGIYESLEVAING